MLERLKALAEDRSFRAHETARMDELNSLPLASFRLRAAAIAIDFALVAVLQLPFHGFRVFSETGREAGVAGLLRDCAHEVEHLLESALYFAVMLKWMKGQTPGKRLMGIRVVSLTHHEIGWWQSIERALGYGASLLEGGFGFLQFYINRNRQCVHDRIAETIVVNERRARGFVAEPAAEPETEPEPEAQPDHM